MPRKVKRGRHVGVQRENIACSVQQLLARSSDWVAFHPSVRNSRHPIDTPLLEGTSSGLEDLKAVIAIRCSQLGFNAENSNQRRSSLAGSQKRASAQSKGLASIFHLRLSFLHPYDFPPHKRRALVYRFFGEQNRQNDLDVVVK